MGRKVAATALAVLLLAPASCATARRASQVAPISPGPDPDAATAVAPVQPPGLDGRAGLARRNACTTIDAAALGKELHTTVKAQPALWNDAGVPSLDLCALRLGTGRTVQIGVSALSAEPGLLERLYRTLGAAPSPAEEIGTGGRIGPAGAAFRVADRAVRITGRPAVSSSEAGAIASAVSRNIATIVPPARITERACQPASTQAERFLGASAQLRRDYRVHGALTCIWGTADRTVAIVESLSTAMPEAERTPQPAPAPVGRPGYYVRDLGELVFRSGRGVVRVSALAEPPVAVPIERLLDIVEPVMPLFVR